MQRSAAVSSAADHDSAQEALEEARECLAYWEERAASLPLRSVRQRREARDMAARWQSRVADAERELYGRGLLGAVMLYHAERRLPQPTRQAGLAVAHRVKQLVMVVVVPLLALLVAGAVAAFELIQAFIDALTRAPL